MSKSSELYRVTLSNNRVIELQKDDIDGLKKALEDEEKSAEVQLPGEGNHKMTIYLEHIVSIEATALVRRGIGFIETTEVRPPAGDRAPSSMARPCILHG